MNLFREISLKVHPDIVGNNPLNNDRMREVLKYRSNENMLIGLAHRWGLDIQNIGPTYTSYNSYEGQRLFKTVYGRLYIVKDLNHPYANRNVRLVEHKSINRTDVSDDVFARFRCLHIWQNYSYSRFGEHANILIRNKTVFKVAKLLRTTKKCVYVEDLNHVKGQKRYNMTSVIGREVADPECNNFI